jgi:hypothetical protein
MDASGVPKVDSVVRNRIRVVEEKEEAKWQIIFAGPRKQKTIVPWWETAPGVAIKKSAETKPWAVPMMKGEDWVVVVVKILVVRRIVAIITSASLLGMKPSV